MDEKAASAKDLNDLGVSHAKSGRIDEAAQCFRRAVAADANFALAHENLAKALAESGDLAAAAPSFRRALQLNPRSVDLLNGLGVVLSKQKDYAGAVATLRKAIDLDPVNASVHNNLGITLASAHRPREAVGAFHRAVELSPNFIVGYSNLGLAMVHAGRPDDAIVWLKRAIEMKPEYAEAHCNLGIALTELGQLDEALKHYARALEIDPNYADVRMNRSATLFLMGDYETGWQEYEFRFFKPENVRVTHDAPRWDGSPLAGRTLLLEAEQGMGDTLQFVRYATEIKWQHEGRIVLAVEPALVPLLTGVAGVDELRSQADPRPPFDVWSPLLSLPGLMKHGPATFPSKTPYLTAEPARVELWKTRLANIRGLKIGIAWQGTKFNKVDHRRSFPLRTFAPLSKLHGVTLISLQKGEGSEQLDTLADFDVVQLGKEFDSQGGAFLDTAAVMKNLDLVITADTSIGHLAGALGVPVWLPLALAPDWRWGMEGEKTPWYPTMRLFRQTKLRDWAGVFERIADTVLTEFPEVHRKQPGEFVLASSGFNRLARTRHGPLVYNRHDAFVGRSLGDLGEFLERQLEVFRQCIRPGGVVVEAGAQGGALTVPLAKLVGESGIVHALEPQRLLFQTLAGNIALNSLTHVRCHQAAAGATAGEVIVPVLDSNQTNYHGGLSLVNFADGERVPVVTIDSLGLTRCDLIKLDVGSMALAALAGAEQTIRRFRPLLHVTSDRHNNSADLITALQKLEYQLFWHVAPAYRTASYYANPNNPFDTFATINILGIHSSLKTNIQGLPPIDGPSSDWRKTG